jgi:hypothetical protein
MHVGAVDCQSTMYLSEALETIFGEQEDQEGAADHRWQPFG